MDLLSRKSDRKTDGFVVLALSAVVCLLAAGAAGKEPAQVVEDSTAQVVDILKRPDYQKDRRKNREDIRQVLLGIADMPTVSALALAQHRKKFSDAQFTQFTDAFSRLLFTTYIARMEEYTNQKIVTVSTEDEGKGRKLVKTKVISDKEIPIHYRMLPAGDSWRVYDVVIEGVSLVQNYRQQFHEILVNNPPEHLIERIEKKAREHETTQ